MIDFVNRHAGKILAACAVIAAILVVAGCGSPSYRENAADVKAGIEAARQEPDAAKRAAIYEAVAMRTWAMLASIDDLPAPTVAPADIRADVDAYASSGANIEADPPEFDTLTDKEPKPSPADIVRSIGERVLSWSIWIALAGLVVLLMRFVPWFGIGAVARFLTMPAALATSGGSVSSAAGTAAIWMADYWPAVVCVAIASAAIAFLVHVKWPKIAESAKRMASSGKAKQ